MSKIFEYGIIGLGPAGIGVAMSLAKHNLLPNTVCFERGTKVTPVQCTAITQGGCCNADICNVISGVGGASNLSSGKISDFPAGSGLTAFYSSEEELKKSLENTIHILQEKIGIKKVRIDNSVIENAASHYADMDIKYKYYDVYEYEGEKYQEFISDTISNFLSQGLTLFDNTEVVDIRRDLSNSYYILDLETKKDKSQVAVKKLIIATGSLDLRDKLISKIENTENLCYEIGTRIELKSKSFGDILSSHGDLKLKFGQGRTYCVTENGVVITYKTDDLLFLEGSKSINGLTDYSNMAILIRCNGNKSLLSFVEKYRMKYNGHPIKQTYSDYCAGRKSSEDIGTTCIQAKCADINDLFPLEINRSIKAFIDLIFSDCRRSYRDEMVLIAPELKMLRHVNISSNFEALPNMFVVGAATGKYRGILQSLCSGITCGERMLRS